MGGLAGTPKFTQDLKETGFMSEGSMMIRWQLIR